MRGEIEDDELASVEFTKFVTSLDTTVDALECVCVRWAAAENRQKKIEIDRLEGEKNRTAAEKMVGVIPFGSALIPVRVVWGNIAVHPLTTELAWPCYRFYNSRFH